MVLYLAMAMITCAALMVLAIETATGSERNVVVRMNLREKRTVVSYLTDNNLYYAI